MKKKIFAYGIIVLVALFSMTSCTVSYINTSELRANYEKKIHHTTMLGNNKKKLDLYDNVKVFLDGNEIGREYEVVAYGSYTPIIIPIIRPERPRLEKNLLWKAAKKARKLGANGVIIDNKNDFTVINIK